MTFFDSVFTDEGLGDIKHVASRHNDVTYIKKKKKKQPDVLEAVTKMIMNKTPGLTKFHPESIKKSGMKAIMRF